MVAGIELQARLGGRDVHATPDNRERSVATWRGGSLLLAKQKLWS